MDMELGKFVGLPISKGVHNSVWDYMINNTRKDVDSRIFTLVNDTIYSALYDRTSEIMYRSVLTIHN